MNYAATIMSALAVITVAAALWDIGRRWVSRVEQKDRQLEAKYAQALREHISDHAAKLRSFGEVQHAALVEHKLKTTASIIEAGEMIGAHKIKVSNDIGDISESVLLNFDKYKLALNELIKQSQDEIDSMSVEVTNCVNKVLAKSGVTSTGIPQWQQQSIDKRLENRQRLLKARGGRAMSREERDQ